MKKTISILLLLYLVAAGCSDQIDEETCGKPEMTFLTVSTPLSQGFNTERTRTSLPDRIQLVSNDKNNTLDMSVEVDDITLFPNPGTKGVPVNGDNIDMLIPRIGIKSFFGDESYFLDGEYLESPSKITGSTGVTMWNSHRQYYWPEENDTELDFWLWAPFELPTGKGMMGPINVDNANRQMSFNYTLSSPESMDETESIQDAGNQMDIILGYTKASSSTSNGNVPIQFKHVLSALRFKIGRSDFGVLQTVAINGVKSKGLCIYNADQEVTWTDLSESKCFTESFNVSLPKNDDPSVYRNINEIDDDKTFMVIPQTLDGESQMLTLSFLKNGETEPEIMTAVLPAGEWEAGKIYTYRLDLHDPSMDIHVDFSNTELDIPGRRSTFGYTESSLSVSITGDGDGQFEKIYIPIKNLELGRWYRLHFTEDYRWQSGNAFNKDCIYATSVRKGKIPYSGNKNNSNSYKSMICHNTSRTDGNANDKPWYYVWEQSENYFDNNYNEPHNGDIIFQAEDQTMLWVWDLSKNQDNNTGFSVNITLDNIELIQEPQNEYIDFMNASFYGFDFSGPSGKQDYKMYGYGTFKVNASYSMMDVRLIGRGGIYEKINVPIKGLTIGDEYTLTFKFMQSGTLINNNALDLCFAVKDSEFSDSTSNTSYHNNNGFSDNINKTNEEVQINITFTATNETMFWVWSLSKIEDGKYTVFKLYDVSLQGV